MVFIAILIGCILGAIVGINVPTISYSYSSYLAIAIVAALDSVFGGITGVLKREFDFKIFISGFFCNSILSILLTYLGNKLDVDIYLAAIVVFVGRMFLNLTIIRKYYIEKWLKKYQEYKDRRKTTEKQNLWNIITILLQEYYKNITITLDFCPKM